MTTTQILSLLAGLLTVIAILVSYGAVSTVPLPLLALAVLVLCGVELKRG